MCGHWVDKCWKVHLELHQRHGKGVVQANRKEKVVYERFGQELIIQGVFHEKSHLSKGESVGIHPKKSIY